MKDFRDPSTRSVVTNSPYFAATAFTITWVLAIWRVSPSANWTGDYATVRGLALAPLGSDGVVSAVLAMLVRSIPIGTPGQRVALVSAFGAGWVAWFAYQLVVQALDGRGLPTRSSCWLALGGSLLVTMSVPLQSIATTAEGSTLAVAACLASIWFAIRQSPNDLSVSASEVQLPFVIGACLTLTWLEDHRVGLLATALVVLHWAAQSTGPKKTQWHGTVAGAGVVLLGLALPWSIAKRGFVAARLEHAFLEDFAFCPFSSVVSWMRVFFDSFGAIWSVLAIGGFAAVMLSEGRRQTIWTIPAVGLIPCIFALDGSALRARDAALTIVALVGLTALATRGLRDLVRWVLPNRKSASDLGMTLAILSQAVAVLARSEETAFASDHYRSLGSESFTDEALIDLPARTVVLARGRRVVERLLAAQVVDAVRPDVLVVPLERSTDPRVVAQLVSIEPALVPVLRELAINGKPTENALSSLADVRPLSVEFDGSWDPRLREHLLVQPLLHRVFSQTTGRSDRTAALAAGQRAVARILAVTADASKTNTPEGDLPNGSERTTRHVLDYRLREQLTLLLALGDRASFETLAADYGLAYPRSRWLPAVRMRMGMTQRGSIDVFDLLNRSEADVVTPATALTNRPSG